MEKKMTQVDRITYSESVKINIADYESRDVFLSYSTDVQPKETVEEAVVRAKKIVVEQMGKVEKVIRKKSRTMVEFDTMAKLNTR